MYQCVLVRLCLGSDVIKEKVSQHKLPPMKVFITGKQTLAAIKSASQSS